MGKGDKFRVIFNLLKEGKSIEEIIRFGFPRRTVYWAAKKFRSGETPKGVEPKTSSWVEAGIKAGWVHKSETCPGGVIIDNEIWTDEGIIKERVCDRCGKVIVTWFDRWTPTSKEIYADLKRRWIRD